MDRQFYAAKPNEKWLTDVTEFKWYEIYLSAIWDLCDRRSVREHDASVRSTRDS